MPLHIFQVIAGTRGVKSGGIHHRIWMGKGFRDSPTEVENMDSTPSHPSTMANYDSVVRNSYGPI